MIGSINPLVDDVDGLVAYLQTGRGQRQLVSERVDWVEFRNLPTRDVEVGVCMMKATAGDSVTGTTKPFYHFSISCAPDDPVDADMLRGIADRTIRDLGLAEYEAIVFAHKDRSHPHLHFVVNRVHPERFTLWSNWWDYARVERSLRAQEVELGLRIVPGWLARVPVQEIDGLGQEGRQLRPRPRLRRGDAAFIAAAIERATPVLKQARSWAELERGLAEAGLALRVKGGGMILTDGRQHAKASEIGREFSRGNLEKRFGLYPDYRARVAAANALAPTTPFVRPGHAQFHALLVQALPSPAPEAAPAPQPSIHTLRRPQFGDAGHGINELFGYPPAPAREQPGVVVEHSPAVESQTDGRETFLRTVQERATPVFERAQSWAELERGLSDHGLFLRVKGGGFVVTDGEQEVKASDVGRPFSRFHLEKRLGRYPDPSAPAAQLEVPAPAEPNSVGSPELTVEVVPAVEATPVSSAPAVASSKMADTQLPIPLPEPPAPPASPTTTRESAVPVQLGLTFGEPPAAPRRRERPTSAVPAVTPVEAPVPAPRAVPQEPVRPAPGTSNRAPAPVHPVRPIKPRAPRFRHDPPTRADRYRKVVWRFKRELARLYSDPRAARRAFDVHLGIHGRSEAMSTLLNRPEAFGELRELPSWPEHIVEVARRADRYAGWRGGGLRPLRAAAAELLDAAANAEEAGSRVSAARADLNEAARFHEGLAQSLQNAEAAEQRVSNSLAEVYLNPRDAGDVIEAHYRLHGAAATVQAIRNTPKSFGKIIEQGWVSRIRNGSDARRERERAERLAGYYGNAFRARECRPTSVDLSYAERAINDARSRLRAEEAQQDALPIKYPEHYITDVAHLVRQAAQKLDLSVEHVMRRVVPALSSGAARMAIKVLEAVHEQERQQERTRDSGHGFEF